MSGFHSKSDVPLPLSCFGDAATLQLCFQICESWLPQERNHGVPGKAGNFPVDQLVGWVDDGFIIYGYIVVNSG